MGISGKELKKRRRRGKGQNRQVKRQKKRNSSCSHPNSCSIVDRLPDDILVHILSLLPRRDCVQSSILCKRWRLLWAHVPNLKLDSRDHETNWSFIDFSNRFVSVHKGRNIHTLRIEFCEDYDDMESTGEYKSEIETLIGTAIACNVQVIKIRSDFELVLPQALFTCKTLVELTLKYFCCEFDTKVYLPALVKLKLSCVRYESAVSLVRLLSGCPALEELTIITNKDDEHVDCVFVSSPTLTRLNLDIYFQNVKDCEVKLDTPALQYLMLHDSSSQNFSTGMLASLIEACVFFSESVDNLYSRSILEFVSKQNNVSYLNLTIGSLEVPDFADSALTRIEFRNLTKLELAGEWRLLTTFLENSDNLQVLSVDMFPVDKHQFWMEPKQVPVCLKNHLRRVDIFYFGCSDPELNMVKYVLKNAKVLTMMKIHVLRDVMKEKKALERITLFERASEACQLTFEYE